MLKTKGSRIDSCVILNSTSHYQSAWINNVFTLINTGPQIIALLYNKPRIDFTQIKISAAI